MGDTSIYEIYTEESLILKCENCNALHVIWYSTEIVVKYWYTEKMVAVTTLRKRSAM